MSNLKRILALSLVVVMTLALVVSAGAITINDYPDKADIVNQDEVAMLAELQIMQGKDTGFDPTGSLTRAEICKMIYVGFNRGLNDDANNFKGLEASTPFTDVRSSDWFVGFVNWAYGKKVVAGKTVSTFDPQGKVTGYEAAKMLLVALDFEPNKQGYNKGAGWALAVAIDAQRAGLLDGLETIDLSLPLSRDNAAKMIYNMIFADMITYDKDDDTLVRESGQTFGGKYLGLESLTGVVVANEYTGIGAVELDEGKTEIAVTDTSEGASSFKNTNVEIEKGTTIAQLGQQVKVFFRMRNGKVDKVYGNVTETGKTKTYTKTTKGAGTYADEIEKLIKDEKLVKNPLYLINYKIINPTDVNGDYIAITSSEQTTINGVDAGNVITFICVEGKKDLDYVLITKASAYKVTNVNGEKYSFSGAATITNKTSDDYFGLDGLAKDDRVVAIDLGTGKSLMQKINPIESSISGVKSGGDKITIKGNGDFEKSGIAGNFSGAFDSISFGDLSKDEYEGTTQKFFAYNGKLIGVLKVDSVSASSDNYAAIGSVSVSGFDVNAAHTTKFSNLSMEATMIYADGSTKDKVNVKSIRIGGENGTKLTMSDLKPDSDLPAYGVVTAQKIKDYVVTTLSKTNDDYAKAMAEYFFGAFASNQFANMICTYSLDSDGGINLVYPATADVSALTGAASGEYDKATTFGGTTVPLTWNVNSKTVFFVLDGYTDWTVVNGMGSKITDIPTGANAAGTAILDGKLIKAAIVNGKVDAGDTKYGVILDDPYTSGGVVNFEFFDGTSAIANMKTIDKPKIDGNEYSAGLATNEISKGDVIAYKVNASGAITEITKVDKTPSGTPIDNFMVGYANDSTSAADGLYMYYTDAGAAYVAYAFDSVKVFNIDLDASELADKVVTVGVEDITVTAEADVDNAKYLQIARVDDGKVVEVYQFTEEQDR